MIQRYKYYDISRVKKGNYFSETRAFNNYNQLADPAMEYYYGGIRAGLFKSAANRYLITKHPLMLINGILEPMSSPHYCNKAYVADVTGLLRHYKFISTFKKRVADSVDTYELYTNNEFKAYKKIIGSRNRLDFNTKNRQYFTSADNLVKQGFLKVSELYRSFAEYKD